MVSIDENGKMSYEGKAKTRTDRFIKKAIDTKKETMHIIANNSTTFVGRDGKNYEYSRDDDGNFYSGGAYGGCIVSGKHSSYSRSWALSRPRHRSYHSPRLSLPLRCR